ncbi:MAG: hypothetical protein KBD97_04310 [Bacteroidaceae bacterium]|nr:hypothetical protein [Bacteroidaceae bacterium]
MTDTQINVIARYTNYSFWGIWILAISIVLSFEFELFPSGLLVGEDRLLYFVQSFGVLLAIVAIPGALKLFHIKLQELLKLPKEEALRPYLHWAVARDLALGFVIQFNLIFYFLSFNKAFAFIVLITLLATLFCLPGKERVCRDLQIETTNP